MIGFGSRVGCSGILEYSERYMGKQLLLYNDFCQNCLFVLYVFLKFVYESYMYFIFYIFKQMFVQ